MRRWMQLCTCSALFLSCTYDAIQRKKTGSLMTYSVIRFQMKAGCQLPVILTLIWHPLMAILNSWGFYASLPSSWQHPVAKFGIWHPLLSPSFPEIAPSNAIFIRKAFCCYPCCNHCNYECKIPMRGTLAWRAPVGVSGTTPWDQKTITTGKWQSKEIAQGKLRHRTKLSLTFKYFFFLALNSLQLGDAYLYTHLFCLFLFRWGWGRREGREEISIQNSSLLACTLHY